jgi:hypothetical protein
MILRMTKSPVFKGNDTRLAEIKIGACGAFIPYTCNWADLTAIACYVDMANGCRL